MSHKGGTGNQHGSAYREIFSRNVSSPLSVNRGELSPERLPVEVDVWFEQMMQKMFVTVQFVGAHHEVIVTSLGRRNLSIWERWKKDEIRLSNDNKLGEAS